jgi:hypothetical protein
MVRSEWDTRCSPPKLWASGQPGITLAVASRGPLGVLPRALGGQTTNAGAPARELSRGAQVPPAAVKSVVANPSRAAWRNTPGGLRSSRILQRVVRLNRNVPATATAAEEEPAAVSPRTARRLLAAADAQVDSGDGRIELIQFPFAAKVTGKPKKVVALIRQRLVLAPLLLLPQPRHAAGLPLR